MRYNKIFMIVLTVLTFLIIGSFNYIAVSQLPHSPQELSEEEKIAQQISEIQEEMTENKINALAVEIQEAFIYQQALISKTQTGIPVIKEKDKLYLNKEELEDIYLYRLMSGRLYFIPASIVNYEIENMGGMIYAHDYRNKDGSRSLYMYTYQPPRAVSLDRIIYPKPDQYGAIYAEEVWESMGNMIYLGRATVKFPDSVPEDLFWLEENEYTRMAVDLVHSYLYTKGMYGDYELYFGEYSAVDESYKIKMRVAIVGKDMKYYWILHAKDTLDENGKVIMESCGGGTQSEPAEYGEYGVVSADLIDEILYAKRLVIPIHVTESDQVKKLKYREDELLKTKCKYYYVE